MFTLILKNDKIRFYNRVALSILLLHLFFFTYFLLRSGTGTAVIIGIAASALFTFLLFTSVKKKQRPAAPAAISFLVLAIVWFMMQNYWFGAALLLLSFLDIITMKKLAVLFYPNKIEYPSFPIKNILWDKLNNVILKDRILTLDFKSNRLIQQEIAEDSYGVDENLFNEFCQARIAAI